MRNYYNSNGRTLQSIAANLIAQGFKATACWDDNVGQGYVTTNADHHSISAAIRAARETL